MTDHKGRQPVAPVLLSAYFAAELRRAERDYPLLEPRRTINLVTSVSIGFVAVAVLLLAAALLLRPHGLSNIGSDATPLAPNGLPASLGGEPVLQGADIGDRIATSDESFLAGGRLVLHPAACDPPTDGLSNDPCQGAWRLDDASGSGSSFLVTRISGGADFVHTSGALTVMRVTTPAGANLRCLRCPDALVVLDVLWRAPTKGRMPTAATPSDGGEIIAALVPDFVGTYGQDGETIVGYIPKEYLLRTGEGVTPGTPDNPPQDEPLPVYGDDLTTLIGHQVPGQGFVPLGAMSPSSAGLTENEAIEVALNTLGRPEGMRAVDTLLTTQAGLQDAQAAGEILPIWMPHLPAEGQRMWVIVLAAGSGSLGQQGFVVAVDFLDGTVYDSQAWIS